MYNRSPMHNWSSELTRLADRIHAVGTLLYWFSPEACLNSEKFQNDLGELIYGFGHELNYINSMMTAAPSIFHYRHADTLQEFFYTMESIGALKKFLQELEE